MNYERSLASKLSLSPLDMKNLKILGLGGIYSSVPN
jgi:hypothetical protein